MSRTQLTTERFGDECGIAIELHPWPEDEQNPGCDIAQRKAWLMDGFFGAFR